MSQGIDGLASRVLAETDSVTAVVLIRTKTGEYALDAAGEQDYEAIMSALCSIQSRMLVNLQQKVNELYAKAGKVLV